MNRAGLEAIQTGYPRATRLKRPRIGLVRPVVVTLILVSVLVLALLMLLLSSGRRKRRARRGRIGSSSAWSRIGCIVWEGADRRSIQRCRLTE